MKARVQVASSGIPPPPPPPPPSTLSRRSKPSITLSRSHSASSSTNPASPSMNPAAATNNPVSTNINSHSANINSASTNINAVPANNHPASTNLPNNAATATTTTASTGIGMSMSPLGGSNNANNNGANPVSNFVTKWKYRQDTKALSRKQVKKPRMMRTIYHFPLSSFSINTASPSLQQLEDDNTISTTRMMKCKTNDSSNNNSSFCMPAQKGIPIKQEIFESSSSSNSSESDDDSLISKKKRKHVSNPFVSTSTTTPAQTEDNNSYYSAFFGYPNNFYNNNVSSTHSNDFSTNPPLNVTLRLNINHFSDDNPLITNSSFSSSNSCSFPDSLFSSLFHSQQGDTEYLSVFGDNGRLLYADNN